MNNKIILHAITMFFMLLVSCSNTEKTDTSTTKAGEPCDINQFALKCEGDNLIYCSDGLTQIQNCAELTAQDGSSKTCVTFSQPEENEPCDEESEDCSNSDSSTSETTTCIALGKQCTVKDDVQEKCEKSASGFTYNRSYQCKEATDGRMFYRRTANEKCYDGYGTCSDKGECKEPIACQDGYETHCESNILYKCNKNRLLSSDCASYAVPRVCTTVEDTPKCMNPEKECQTEGDEIVTNCNTKTNKEAISVCTRAENGKLYYISSGTRSCIDSCNEEGTACKPSKCDTIGSKQQKCRLQGTATTYIDTYTCTETEGEKLLKLTSSEKCDDGHGTCSEDGQCIPAEDCTPSEFTAECINGTAVNCTAQKVRYNHCELSTFSPTCAVVNEKATCFPDSAKCTSEGEEVVIKCNPQTNKESVKQCTRGSDGNLYYVNTGTRACATACKADGTACE